MKKIVGFYFIFIILLSVSHWSFALHSNHYQISFLDIGQGDSIYIKTPQNCRILIDAGKPNTLTDSLINILPFNTKSIDLIIITHPDLDHYGGFTDIAKKYDISNVLISPFQKDTIAYQSLLSDLQKQSSNIQTINRRSKARFCNLDFNFHVFHEQNANDSSIITQIQFPTSLSLLTAGDISTEQELELIEQDFPLKSNIFKANHHGSSSSNHPDFLKSIKPDYMIIQSGHGNSFGHPHTQTLRSGHSANSKILRNDQAGQIDFFFYEDKKSSQQRLELKLER